VVPRGSDRVVHSDEPDVQVDLRALAGPSSGPNGSSILVDAFSGADLAPQNAIREIRIDQNPVSSDYDKLGYRAPL
jgi:hypothetical protein